MKPLGLSCVIVSAVLCVEGLAHLLRLYVRKRRRFYRFQRLLDGNNGLLPTPAGYEELQLITKRGDDDQQGFELGARIGYGSYGVVYHGCWRGAHVAVKVLTYELSNGRAGADVAREAVIGAALSHPNIVRVYLVSTRRVAGTSTDNLETSIVMDYCDCGTLRDQHKTLWELFSRDRAAALRWILRTLTDIAGGLDYMHRLGLIHGDMKCNNVLLDSTTTEARGFRCRIADMGCARLLSTSREAILKGQNGNLPYAAPEFLRENSMTQASDVYAFAIIAWHLMSLGDKFFDKDANEMYKTIVDDGGRPTFPMYTQFSLQKLVEQCWQQLPMKRPTMSAVLQQLHSLYDECL